MYPIQVEQEQADTHTLTHTGGHIGTNTTHTHTAHHMISQTEVGLFTLVVTYTVPRYTLCARGLRHDNLFLRFIRECFPSVMRRRRRRMMYSMRYVSITGNEIFHRQNNSPIIICLLALFSIY